MVHNGAGCPAVQHELVCTPAGAPAIVEFEVCAVCCARGGNRCKVVLHAKAAQPWILLEWSGNIEELAEDDL